MNLECPNTIKVKAYDDTLCKELPALTIDQISKFGGINWYKIHLMYFTGKLDKFEKEIYSDDIVRVTFRTPFGKYKEVRQVTYNKDKAGYEPFVDTFNCDECDTYLYIDEIEVLGNVYKNKELLD